jgi:hypothetical protein
MPFYTAIEYNIMIIIKLVVVKASINKEINKEIKITP